MTVAPFDPMAEAAARGRAAGRDAALTHLADASIRTGDAWDIGAIVDAPNWAGLGMREHLSDVQAVRAAGADRWDYTARDVEWSYVTAADTAYFNTLDDARVDSMMNGGAR